MSPTTAIIPGNPPQAHFTVLEQSIYTALENYSNVHRGSGLFSAVSTFLYEEARKIVLDYLSLDSNYVVIFCSPYKGSELAKKLIPGSFKTISGKSAGLNIGLMAIAVSKNQLPQGKPFHSGGGTTILVSADRVAWASAPDKFEAGTPAVINVIAFARALQLMKLHGNEIFQTQHDDPDKDAGKVHDPFADLTGSALMEALAESIIGRNTRVPVINGSASYINLDYAASTPAFMPVFKAYCSALSSEGPDNFELISGTRTVISKFLNAPAEKYDIIFTSNATESINIVAEGMPRSSVLVSILEHNSDDLPWRACHTVMRLPVNKEGFVVPTELENILSSNPQIKILALSGASNVIGSCNDIAEISKIAHRHGIKVLIDAAQLVAHRKMDIDRCEIDFLVFSGHKAYAPFGTGVLIARKGLLNFSDEKWNMIRSSGEENVAGIAALGKSLTLISRTGLDLIMKEEQALLSKLIEGLSQIDEIKIFGLTDQRELNKRLGVVSFFIKKVWPDKIAKSLAEEGIGIRYGCHCAHILVKYILNVGESLQKFQFVIAKVFRKVRFPGVARISFGIGTTDDDISACLKKLKELSEGRRSNSGSDIKSRMEEYSRAVKEKVFENRTL